MFFWGKGVPNEAAAWRSDGLDGVPMLSGKDSTVRGAGAMVAVNGAADDAIDAVNGAEGGIIGAHEYTVSGGSAHPRPWSTLDHCHVTVLPPETMVVV